jgi:hypothetical protein
MDKRKCPACLRAIRIKQSPEGPRYYRHDLDASARYPDRCVNSGELIADELERGPSGTLRRKP